MRIDDLTVPGLPAYHARHREGPVYVEVALKRGTNRRDRYVAVVEEICAFVGTRSTRGLTEGQRVVAERLTRYLFSLLFDEAEDAGWTEVELPAPNEYGVKVEFIAPGQTADMQGGY